jgi:hypothetical protein
MNKIKTIIIIILIFYSCNSYNQDNADILMSDNLIAYVENPTQSGINHLREGKLVIMDIATKRKYYVNESKSYFNYPVWSKNGKALIYFSEASNDKIRESLRKMIISKDICVFDIQSRSDQLLFSNPEKIGQKFYLMTNKIETTNDNDIFLIPQIETVFQINSKTYEINSFLELDSSYHIYNIDLSPNGKFLIINASSKIKRLDFELLCYSVQDSSINKISTYYITRKGGWDLQSENYLYTNFKNIMNFNIKTNTSDTLSLPIKSVSFISYTKNGEIIGLAKKDADKNKPDEVFLYNQKDETIIWLTDDNIYKECLSVLF